MKNKTVSINVGQRANGKVKVLVIEDGKVLFERPWQKNLILNQGLNNVCSTRTWANSMTHCAAGSGTTPTASASGANPATGTAGTFTNDTPGTFNFTTNSSVGDYIQMTSGADAGTEVRITSVTDANNVDYTPAVNLASGEFTVFHTSQTGLTSEIKRTSTYLTGAGNCGSSFSGVTVTLRRTFDFTVEVGAVTYNEIGISHTATVGSNLFSRILLSSGVNLVAGQSLRVIYDLDVSVGPTTSVPTTFAITGWPVSPSTSLDGDYQVTRPGINGIGVNGATASSGFLGWDFENTTGGAQQTDGGLSLEPSAISSATAARFWISPSSTAIQSFNGVGGQTNRNTNAFESDWSLNSYTAFDFSRTRTVSIPVGSANRTDWRSMGFGADKGTATQVDPAINGQSFVCLFDEAQTKDSLHTLTLNFRITVGRVLA